MWAPDTVVFVNRRLCVKGISRSYEPDEVRLTCAKRYRSLVEQPSVYDIFFFSQALQYKQIRNVLFVKKYIDLSKRRDLLIFEK